MNKSEKVSDKSVKVLMVGNSAVGKTSIMVRYLDDFYVENFLPTVGIDFKTKVVGYSGQNLKLNLWDTAGQEKFRTLTTSYYKGANAVIFVYDITDRSSFSQLRDWILETKKYVGNDYIGIITGNKLDLEEKRVVQTNELLLLAEDLEMPIFEVSAKTGDNINEMFETVVDLIMTEEMKRSSLSEGYDLNLDNGNKKKKSKDKFKKCC
jgi:Ras-related protein Rab-1A